MLEPVVSRDLTHDLMPQTDHDGMSRRLAVLALKRAVGGVLQPALMKSYETNVKPRTEERLGRPVKHAEDFRNELKDTPQYRLWSSVNRAAQHRMWTMLSNQIDADYDRIEEASQALPGNASLVEPVDFSAPGYIAQADIHCQPGGYLLDRFDGDLGAGLLYEMGGNIYAMGQNIGAKDSKAQRIINFICEEFPGLKPRKVLELGCSAGAQTTYYPEAFPSAEIHAVDVSPAMLRYAKKRSDTLGANIQFQLADAGDLPYADNEFDLIVSHNMLHETEASHQRVIMRDCERVLAPGGLCLHQDVAVQLDMLPPFIQFLSEWQKENNGEPFWLDYASANVPELLVKSGFGRDHVKAHYLDQLDGPLKWYVVTAQKP